MTTSNKNWLDFNSTNPLTAFSLFKQQSKNDYNRENSYCLSRWRQYEVCTLVTVTIPGAGHLSKEPVSDQLNRLSCELYRRSSAVQLGPRSYRRMWGLAPDLPPHMWSSLELAGPPWQKIFEPCRQHSFLTQLCSEVSDISCLSTLNYKNKKLRLI